MRESQHPAVPTFTKIASIALFGFAGSALAHDGIETRLKSYREVPSVSSTAVGKFKASVDEKSGAINYELSYSGLQGDVRMAHIHLGQRGVNGGIMVWLCQTSTNPDPTGLSPTCPQSGTVTGTLQAANVIGPAGQGVDPMEFAEVLAAIRAGVAYANVHSSKFPAGEIRGQLQGDD
jgi:CHRD domain